MKFFTHFILLAFVTTSTLLSAQTTFSVGVRAGINFAGVKASDNYEADFIAYNIQSLVYNKTLAAGLNLSIPFNIRIGKYFSLQPEIGYFGKGGGRKASGNGNLAEQKVKMHYLEVPIMLRPGYYTDKFSISLVAGPSIGFLLGGKLTESGSNNWGSYSEEYKPSDYSEYVKKMELGFVLGIGGTFNVGKGSVTFDLRRNMGLTPFLKVDDEAYTFKNRGFSISIGYLHTLNMKKSEG